MLMEHYKLISSFATREACIWVMPSEITAQGQRIDRVILYTHTSHNGFLSVASNKFMLPFVIGEGC
jgi:hypothetical protein